jgi:hypothetical protein
MSTEPSPNPAPAPDAVEKAVGGAAQRPEPSAPPRSLLLSLGSWCVWVLLVGFIVIPPVIAFLVFLWASNGDNYVWRQIALAGWVARCISLASAILRITIAIQAGAGTSIIAALTLQRYEVRLPNAPAVSMLRWQNSGPHVLARLMMSTPKTSPALFLIILTMTLIAITSQFMSTILLADLNQSLTFSNEDNSSFYYEFDHNFTSINKINALQSSY